MTKIIYYCDLHQGPLHEPSEPTDVRLHGHCAFDMNRALLEYAWHNNIDDIIHGGDESTFVKGDLSHHMRRATLIGGSMQYQAGDLHRVIGNHDPITRLKELGFQTESYKKQPHKSKNRIVILQPQIKQTCSQAVYDYHIPRVSRIFPPAHSKTNLIVASHWALDRMERGYPKIYDPKGYAYHDNTEELKKRLAKHAGEVISLHGHEHRFSLTTTLGFQCLVMPSIIQADIVDENKPCGLFVEIADENEDGSLRFTFKKINLNAENPEVSQIETVDLAYMQRYHRPVLKTLFT